MTLLLALLVMPAQAASLNLSDDRPVRGEAIEVTLDPDGADFDGAKLVVTYRPNSVLESTEELEIDGLKATWTPQHAGISVLSVTKDKASAKQSVSVAFPSLPLSGLAVFLFASTVLFGGMAWSFSRLMRGRDEGLTVEDLPMDS